MRDNERKKHAVMVISGVSEKDGGSNAALIENVQQLKDKYNFIVIVPSEGSFSRQLHDLNIKYQVIRSTQWRGKKKNPLNIRAFLQRYKRLFINLKADVVLAQMIKNLDINLVHINISSTNVGFFAAFIMRRPLLWHLRELNDIDQGLPLSFPRFSRFLFRRAHLVAVSVFVKNYYQKFLKYKNIYLLRDGIETGSLLKIPNLPKVRPGTVKILFLGGYQYHKGLDIVLEAMEKLQEESVNVVLTVYGSQYSENMHKYAEYVIKNGLQDRVFFHGFTDDTIKAISRSDIVISASLEAFGRVATQAIVAGRIAIGSDAGATSEIIKDGYNGYLFRHNSSISLANKIKMVFDDWTILIQNIQLSRDRAEYQLSSVRTANDLDKLYKKLIQKS